MKPLFNRVLLHREKYKSVGNIIIPIDAKKKYAKAKGRVVAVGPDVDEHIEVGKWYVFGRYAGVWMTKDGGVLDQEGTDFDDVEYFVLNDDDLIAEVDYE